jgi:hypothetical protein
MGCDGDGFLEINEFGHIEYGDPRDPARELLTEMGCESMPASRIFARTAGAATARL